MRLREFKEPRQRLDEAIAVPIWFALVGLLGGAVGSWNTMSDKQKADSKNWLRNNIAKNRKTVKKVLPYLVPGGLGGSNTLNSPVGVEKLKPIINNPEQFNIGIKNKKLPQPGPTTGTDKKIKNTQPTPLVQPDGSTGSAPSVLDNITSWFKDTFGSDTEKTAPVSKVDKSVLAPSIDSKTKKVKPAYTIPNIAAPVDNGDGTVTWNGQVYDKAFDADKLEKDMKKIKTAPTPSVKKDVLPSIGGGQGGAVSGKKDKTPGATFGNPGIGNQVGTGAVSGGKTDATGKAKEQPGAITGPELDIKGQSIGTTGVGQGTDAIPKGYAAPISKVKVEPIAKAVPNNIARTTTIPPGTIPPPIAQFPDSTLTSPKYRKYDPKTDKDIIYKGREAPKNVAKIDYQKTGPGSGWLDKLRAK